MEQQGQLNLDEPVEERSLLEISETEKKKKPSTLAEMMKKTAKKIVVVASSETFDCIFTDFDFAEKDINYPIFFYTKDFIVPSLFFYSKRSVTRSVHFYLKMEIKSSPDAQMNSPPPLKGPDQHGKHKGVKSSGGRGGGRFKRAKNDHIQENGGKTFELSVGDINKIINTVKKKEKKKGNTVFNQESNFVNQNSCPSDVPLSQIDRFDSDPDMLADVNAGAEMDQEVAKKGSFFDASRFKSSMLLIDGFPIDYSSKTDVIAEIKHIMDGLGWNFDMAGLELSFTVREWKLLHAMRHAGTYGVCVQLLDRDGRPKMARFSPSARAGPWAQEDEESWMIPNVIIRNGRLNEAQNWAHTYVIQPCTALPGSLLHPHMCLVARPATDHGGLLSTLHHCLHADLLERLGQKFTQFGLHVFVKKCCHNVPWGPKDENVPLLSQNLRSRTYVQYCLCVVAHHTDQNHHNVISQVRAAYGLESRDGNVIRSLLWDVYGVQMEIAPDFAFIHATPVCPKSFGIFDPRSMITFDHIWHDASVTDFLWHLAGANVIRIENVKTVIVSRRGTLNHRSQHVHTEDSFCLVGINILVDVGRSIIKGNAGTRRPMVITAHALLPGQMNVREENGKGWAARCVKLGVANLDVDTYADALRFGLKQGGEGFSAPSRLSAPSLPSDLTLLQRAENVEITGGGPTDPTAVGLSVIEFVKNTLIAL